MKKQLLWLLMAAPLGLFAQEAPFVISGQLKNFTNEDNQVFLIYPKDGKRVTDTAQLIDGKYSFKGTIGDAIQATLLSKKTMMRPAPKYMANIFLEPGSINIEHVDSFSNTTITGSAANAEFAKLKSKTAPLEAKMQALGGEYRTADAAGKARIEEEYNALEGTMKEAYLAAFNANPSSPLALFLLQNYLPNDIDADKAEPLYKKLSAKAQASAQGKAMKAGIDAARMTGIGKIAPEFTQNDTLDKPVQLASFRGKYVLVDFWASWCGPCRAENPNVVKAFNAYKDKGFTVLGVSLDQPGAKEKWLKAIHDDGLTWTHVSDLQFWNNAAAKAYGIRSIPQNFLLDPQGKIVGKNLRGEALDKKLAELLKG
jgi:peroxiredoxin